MSSFYTEFPIKNDISFEQFLRLGLEWASGIRESRLQLEGSALPPTGEEWTVGDADESLHVACHSIEHGIMGGLRHSRIDKEGRRWWSEFVGSKIKQSFWISVRVRCDSSKAAIHLPVPKKPVLIKMIMKEKWGAFDGDFVARSNPHLLKDEDQELAEGIVLGTSTTHLPIVYVSCYADGEWRLDSNKLARELGGLAHVVVEPSRSFSWRLAKASGFKNPYEGAVGVYWPEGAASRRYLAGTAYDTWKDVEKALVRDITVSLTNRRGLPRCSWEKLREISARRRIERLHSEGSQSLKDYVDAFDGENTALQDALRNAESEIDRLKREALNLKKNMHSGGISISAGNELDYYPGEIRHVLLSVLEMSLEYVPENSRRKHIIEEIIRSNEDPGIPAGFEELKSCLHNYTGIDKSTRDTLCKIGFEIHEQGKHYKLIYRGDERYTFTLAKTPSDHRTGKNTRSDISKAIF